MRINWKTALAGTVTLLLVVWLTQIPRDSTEDRQKLHQSSAQELQIKQELLDQDVQMTEKLCRYHCRLDIQQMVSSLSQPSDKLDPVILSKMQTERPHMRYLEAVSSGEHLEQGKLDDLPEEVRPYIELARDTVRAKNSYESPRIKTSDGPYFVLAMRLDDKQGYVLGAVKQQIIDQIHTEQRKNLRIVPYPSDGRFGIQAADSDTLQKVDVDHPEENEDISHYFKHDVVVSFVEQLDQAELERIREELDAATIDQSGYAYVIRSNSWTAEEMMEYLQSHYQLRYVEPHFLYVTNQEGTSSVIETPPNDALYAQYQWNLPQIRTEPGWQIAQTGEDVIVAVVDTGVDLNHPDLQQKLVTGYNVYTDGSDAYDDVGHGTHVAGIIAAQINNYEGIAGVAPQTRIMPIKVLDSSGAGSTYAVAQGIIWATDNGAQVINLSLGNYAQAAFLQDAIRYAYDRNVVLVAATGNDYTEAPGYPAAYPEVFAVGATDYNERLAQFSNYGSYVDVSAPGVSIASTYPGSQYASLSGTSMACPHVAALAAMIRSTNPTLSNEQVMQLIRSTSVDLGDAGHDIYYGHGRIDVQNALLAAQNSGQSIMNWSKNLQSGIDRIIAKYE